VLLSALDLLGVMDPTRPPIGVAAVEIVAIVTSLGILAITTRRVALAA